jgi:hypothetical protein
MPNFVPKPSEVYEGYVALEMPRTEVPVGALWVQDYGPSGEGAAGDNLVTERSLSQITINADLHFGLTAGILNLFGLDPSYRNKVSARFGDLSIVRVRDMTKLFGPASEPRIYEAIRAGSVTISTDNEVGLDLETRALGRNLPVVGRSDNGRRRSFSIDGKDMFIAFRVASQEVVKSAVEKVRFERLEAGWVGTVGGRRLVLSPGAETCSSSDVSAQPPSPAAVDAEPRVAEPPPAPVPTSSADSASAPLAASEWLVASAPSPGPDRAYALTIEFGPAATSAPVQTPSPALPAIALPLAPPTSVPVPQQGPEQVVPEATQPKREVPRATGPVVVPLRVPVADGRGGLFERASVEIAERHSKLDVSQQALCAVSETQLRANVQLLGQRLQTFKDPKAPRW